MSTKTDLAKEIITEKFPKYSGFRKFYLGNTEITEVKINSPEDEKLFSRPKGTYITVEADCLRLPSADFSAEAIALSQQLKALLPKTGPVLAVGIGNPLLAADSLGPTTAGYLSCGKAKGRLLASLCPGTAGITGLHPAAVIKSVARDLAPGAVILIDALAARELDAVCKTVQISDTGLAPGSGAFPNSAAITEEVLGVPVIAIGTPTVASYPGRPKALVSPGDIDLKVKRAAKLIAAAINLAMGSGQWK